MIFTCQKCGRRWTGLGEVHCGASRGGLACHEHYGSTSAYDRHIRVTHRDVVTRLGHLVKGEPFGECRPVSELTELRRNGLPRLVSVQRASGAVWVTEARPAGSLDERATTTTTTTTTGDTQC